MQTFLPYADFEQTAKCLDYRRLGKQRVEAYQLALLMTRPDQKAWRNHPAFKMWDGFDLALIDYALVMCREWIARGYKDTLTDKLVALRKETPYQNPSLPSWLGNEDVHKSHRSALMHKQYDWYKQFDWSEDVKLEYVWPV